MNTTETEGGMVERGGAVESRSTSDWHELPEPWRESGGRVDAVFDAVVPPRIDRLYGAAGPLAGTVLASPYETDPIGCDGPF